MNTEALSGWTHEQGRVVPASFLGWTLGALDLFLLVFALKEIAAEFHTDISDGHRRLLLTLAMGPLTGSCSAVLQIAGADRVGEVIPARTRSHANRVESTEPRPKNTKPRVRSGSLCARTHARSNPERVEI
jgi:hypothetical protein